MSFTVIYDLILHVTSVKEPAAALTNPIITLLNKTLLTFTMQNQKYKTYYDLEIEKLVEDINKNKYKNVLLQFPDGLKYYSKEVIDELTQNTKTNIFTYFGTCFGACDIPLYLKDLGIELCVQWGHSVYIKKKEMW